MAPTAGRYSKGAIRAWAVAVWSSRLKGEIGRGGAEGVTAVGRILLENRNGLFENVVPVAIDAQIVRRLFYAALRWRLA